MNEMECQTIPPRFDAAKLDPAPWAPGLLHGEAGCGKTYRAVQMTANGAMFVSIPVYIREMREMATDDTDPRWYAIKRIKNAKRLILDDLGAEKLTDFAAEILYDLIDYRWGNLLETVVTSNLSPSEIAAKHGDRIASRILGFGKPVSMIGTDRRAQ